MHSCKKNTSGQIVPKYLYRHIGGFFIPLFQGGVFVGFFSSAINTLQTLVIALGAGLAVWGVINLLEGYRSDNPAAKSQGVKQVMAN